MDTPKKAIRNSPYTVYSGIAAEDLVKDSIILKVICPELIPNTSFGTIGAGVTQSTISLKDRDGNAISSQVTTANHLVATWEGQSNHRYPPMVRNGEPVEVFKLSNQDKFYWRTTGRGRDFRTTDRVHIEIGATDPSKPGVDKTDDNTYSMYMDSTQQKIGFKTSAVNGEASAFSMEADLRAGIFYLTDNSEEPANRIYLDTGAISGSPTLQLNISTGVTLKFEGDHAFFKVPGKLEMDVGDRFVINSPLTVFNLSKTGAVIMNAASIAMNTAKDFVITSGNVVGIAASSTKIGGVLVAGAVRSANVVKGALGSLYKAVSVDRPEETPVINASNSSDTDTSGIPYKST